jgi:hypothetical protein
VVRRIRRERRKRRSFAAIAERLKSEGVPTAQSGNRWYPSTVRAVASR